MSTRDEEKFVDIPVEFSEEEYNELKEQADAVGMSVEEYISMKVKRVVEEIDSIDKIIDIYDSTLIGLALTPEELEKMTNSRNAFEVLKGHIQGDKTKEELDVALKNIATNGSIE